MNAIEVSETYLYTKLIAAAGLTALVSTRIYADEAPQGTALPYVVFQPFTPADHMLGGGDYIQMTTADYLVKAVTEARGKASVNAIMTQITTALHDQQGTVGALTVDSVEVGILPLPSVESGKQYKTLAGRYRIFIRPELA